MGSNPDNEGTRRNSAGEDETDATQSDSAARTSSRTDYLAERGLSGLEHITEPLPSLESQSLKDHETRLQGISPEQLKEYTDDDLQSEYKCYVRGSLADIVAYVHSRSEIWYSKQSVYPYVVSKSSYQGDEQRRTWVVQSGVTGTRSDGSPERVRYGIGLITKLPGREVCELSIVGARYLRHLKYWWDRLFADIQSAGLIVDMQQMAGSTEGIERPKDIPATKVGGHKGLACNEWAYNEYYEKRRSAGEILPEYISRWENEMGKSIDELADPRQSMMSAIRYRRKKLLEREDS